MWAAGVAAVKLQCLKISAMLRRVSTSLLAKGAKGDPAEG